jgi:predicted transcriptional regulator
MITEAQVVPMLAEACPSFQSSEELLYLVLGDFARHLLELHRQGQTATFPEVARVIERLQVEGTHSVREAATIGLLEGVQNVWANEGVDPELFAAHLLPESRRWWEELNAFWRGDRRYIGEGLEEKGGSLQ